MDLQTALLCLVAFVVLAVLVYFISVFGVKGKTFEEAIEEQRRRDKEILQPTKSDKPKKDKKYKKLTKRTKEKVTPEEELPPVTVVDSHVDFKAEAEIIPIDLNLETKPGKAKKKPKPNLPPKSILLNKQDGNGIVPEIVLSAEKEESDPPTPPAKLPVPKDEVERKLSLTSTGIQCTGFGNGVAKESLVNGEAKGKVTEEVKVVEMQENKKKREESKSPEKEKVQKEDANLVTQSPSAPSNKKNKKTKQDSIELVDGDVPVKKLFAILKNATLVGDEIQMLIEILLNKQQGEAAEWTKKNDPMVALKKQLQEKEQQLEEERRMVQSVSVKTKELRQELNQEKARFNVNERNARDKLQQQQQEIANLQANLQRSRDQHQSETSLLQTKLQQLQHHKNEVNKLEQKISQLEAEKQSWLGLEIQLQQELEQLRASREQNEAGRAVLEKEREALNQQVLRLEAQAQELRDVEHRNASLVQELQRAKNTCNTLEGERNTFQKRLETQEQQQHRKLEEETHKFKAALRESQTKQQENEMQVEQHLNQIKNLENKNNDSVQQIKELQTEVEELRSQLLQAQESQLHEQNGELPSDEPQKIENVEQNMIIEEKEKLVMQLRDEVNLHKTQVLTLTDELDSQKQKNNELRGKNWKAMEALSKLEVSSQKEVLEIEERFAKVQEEASKLRLSSVEQKEKINELHRISEEQIQQKLVQRIHEEQQKHREAMTRLFPEIRLDDKMDQVTWLKSYEKSACQLLSVLRESGRPDASQSDDKRVAELGEQNTKLEALVQHYKTVLSDTEDILKKLQSRVEAAELEWKEKLGAKEQDLQKTLAEKVVLEASIKEHQSLEVATSEVRELQAKLKELQAKLEGEEQEKKLLEQKFGEVSKNAQDLKDQIEGRQMELQELRSEKVNYDKTLQDLEKVRGDLEKEKRITKDLSSHTVKLQSLVKIGQDALQAEQDLVKSLQAQIDLSTVAATNGTPVTPAKTVPEIEGALGKK